jgi:phage-related protein (TIGR01555 family)
MGWFSWFKRKPAAPEAAAPVAAKRPAMKISDAVVSAARAQSAAPAPVFVMPKHPPGVGPAGGTGGMAMDANVTGAQTWANSALASFWNEGVTFLGYAYLSELAQRPEYRVISETIATEMTRKWITFTSTDDEDDKTDRIKELVAEFERLNVRNLFCRATEQDGFFGRGHIYIDTGDTDDAKELVMSIGDGWDDLSKSKIKKGSIKALRTVEAVWCYPTSYNSNDPLKDNWYRPDSWFVQAKTVHSSRLLTFIGREVPDLLKPTYSFGGLSLSQMAKPYVDNWLETRQSVNDIIHSFSVFALLTNLGESLQGDGQQLFRRAELFNNLRDNRGLMMLDKDSEDFKNVSAPLGGLDSLQAQAQEHMASVSHIPTVKLLGIQPAGLNADSEGVMRSFYDYINACQEHQYRDRLHRLVGLAMLNLWGETDKSIGFKFEPLWALNEKDEAEVEKTKAETDQILIDTGSISPVESRKRVANDPGSDYASIDVDDAPDLLDEEEDGLEPQGGRPQPVVEEEEKADTAGAKGAKAAA